MSSLLLHKIVRRAAFDIGSGSTKIQCSDCELIIDSSINSVVGCTILNVLFSGERPVPFGADWMSSVDGNLSHEMQERGLAVITQLKSEAAALGVTQMSAIATEVFRKASNGQSYLDRVIALGIPVQMLTQELEAELAYGSVMVSLGASDISTVWDSGGASFQISSIDPRSRKIRAYMGSLGTGVTTGILMREIQQKEFNLSGSPNPVSLQEYAQFSESLKAKLGAVPDWIQDCELVAASGGLNSMFAVCCDVLQRIAIDSNNGEVQPPIKEFSVDDAFTALQACLDKSDADLIKFVNFEFSDGEKVIVPKLSLLYTVMRHANIKRIKTVAVVGSCAGLLKDVRFWDSSF